MSGCVYHLTPQSEFRAGVKDGCYTPPRFEQDGFVHCAGGAATVLAIAHDYFAGFAEPLLVLQIDPSRLSATLRFEAAAPIPGGGTSHLAQTESFPHVYGSIELHAIVGVAVLAKDGGGFSWPNAFADAKDFFADTR